MDFSLGSLMGDVFGTNTKPAPGVAGAAKPGDALVFDPNTNHYMDPNNGQMYVDQYGTQPVGNVNTAQQTGADFATQQALLSQLGAGRAQQAQGFAGEHNLVNSLNNTIMGSGPSAAQTQLGIGQDALARQQLSQAAGVSGPSGPLAQLMAMRNTAAGQVGVNQQAGLIRADESARAQNTLGSVLNNMTNQGQQGYNANLTGASNYANTSANLATGREQSEEDRQKAQAQQNLNTSTMGLSGASSASGIGGPAAAGG